jgi:hypothetical protein
MCGRQRRQDLTETDKSLVGSLAPTHRRAAAGDRQVSAVFVFFVSFVVMALGQRFP